MKKTLIIYIAGLLFVVIIGGLFLYKYGWGPIYQIVSSGEKIKISNDKKTEEGLLKTEKQVSKENEKVIDGEVKLEPEQLFKKSEELITEAQELILRLEEFIEEKEKEKLLAIQKVITEARLRSDNVKGVYMTEFIANSQAPAALKIKEDIKKLLDETELNSVVIDVKEARGPNLPNSLKQLINEFHQKDTWVIARIVAFRDSSLIEEKPEWYLKSSTATSTATSSGEFWKDWGGGYWLDPSSSEVWEYIIEFSQKVIDFGFDELQFDYIRFPSDGDLENIDYPFYDGSQNKYEVIQEFSLNLSETLKFYKPSIILSVDLFGYVATRLNAFDIGQRLKDFTNTVDYISFMLYPSHFYGGFEVQEDLKRGLPAVSFPYIAQDLSLVVSNQPYEVVYRSILSSFDYLSSFDSKARVRPWLQDFNLKFDTERGIYYDAEKVRAQTKAVKDSGASGWLLWNSANIYTPLEIYGKDGE